MVLIYYKDFKTPNITQFDALGGQIRHMAAQKGFTLHQAQLHLNPWNQPCLSELSLNQLGARENHTHFEPQISLCDFPSCIGGPEFIQRIN